MNERWRRVAAAQVVLFALTTMMATTHCSPDDAREPSPSCTSEPMLRTAVATVGQTTATQTITLVGAADRPALHREIKVVHDGRLALSMVADGAADDATGRGKYSVRITYGYGFSGLRELRLEGNGVDGFASGSVDGRDVAPVRSTDTALK